MDITIYDEPWEPSDINCNWKPEKLSRYSFVTNMINFDAINVKLGYGQSGIAPREDSFMNLTDYIGVNSQSTYFVKYENNINLGIRFICFFNSEKTFISSVTLDSIISSLDINFSTPIDCNYIRITMSKEAWKKCSLRASYSNSLVSNAKDITPLNIVDNKIDTQIYKDIHLEVYVKAEALIKNFVDCFNLSTFQAFPNEVDNPSDYSPTNNMLFKVYNPSYYESLSYSDFISNHSYIIGDKIKYINSYGYKFYYVCKISHISAATYNEEMSHYRANWYEISDVFPKWLQINKNVKESNYNSDINFPYVGYLLFKNLWGCDKTNYLNTFVNRAYLTLTYEKIFAKNLRINESNYDKFFNQGYFDNANNYSSVEGFGIRLIRGESFRNDEILGDFVANNYLIYSEQKNNIPSNWDPTTDTINNSLFGGTINKPFDHYYFFTPQIGIPFFKEKTFEDFKLKCTLQKEDKLGNIFKRIINLPICVKFSNNLIKCYFTNGHSDSINRFYDEEYLNSNQENFFTVPHNTGDVISRVTIWCPNVDKLSVSSTIIGSQGHITPVLITKNGQTCILKWTFTNSTTVGITMRAIHILEYSDGENYDKFTYIEQITII